MLVKSGLRMHIIDLETGDAFFVKIPSNHRYYLPSDSTEWEFIHITIFGEEAIRCYEDITDDLAIY